MDATVVGSTVAIIGLSMQTASAVLLALLFIVLRLHAGRRSYMVHWSGAWIMLAISLLVIAAVFIAKPGIITDPGWEMDLATRAGLFLYLAFKLMFMNQLLSGTLAYTRYQPTVILRRSLAAVAVAAALVIAAVLDGVNNLLAYQAPFLIAGMGFCAWSFLTIAPSRHSLGSRITGVLFAVLTLVWTGYLASFQVTTFERFTDTGFGVLNLLGRYNSFIDLMLQMLLAYGMVLILMEDAKREIDSAHGELAAAHRKLMSESLKDALTGVLNRRAYQLRTGLEHASANFGAIVMLDLDEFKQVNDRHGHAAGDALLQHFADVLRSGMRPTDMLYRWGGDEFMLIMPRARADAVKRRILELLDSAPPLVFGGEVHIPVRASVGAADYTGGDDMEAALGVADAEMYELKRARKSPGGSAPDAWKE